MKKIKIQILIFFILIFFAEAISALLVNYYLKKNVQNFNVDYSFSAGTIGDVKPNQKNLELNYNGRPFFVEFNDQGTRNKKNFCEECNKIFVFGDSQTFGLFINQEDTFVEKIQNRLDENWGIYNLGQTGFEIDSILDHYEDKFSNKIKNSIIIYLFNFLDINSINSDGISKRDRVKKQALKKTNYVKLKGFLKKHSNSYLLLSKIKNKTNKYQLALDQSNLSQFEALTPNLLQVQDFDIFDERIKKLDTYSKNDNNLLISIFIPHPRDLINKDFIIKNYLNKNDEYTLLDLKNKFIPHNLKDLYFLDYSNGNFINEYNNDLHLTRYANNIVSDFIINYLKNNFKNKNIVINF